MSANSNWVSSRYDSAAGFLFQSGTVMRSHTSHSAVHNCVCSHSRARSREHRTPMLIASLSQLAGDVLHPLVDTTPIGFNAASPPPSHPPTRFCFYFPPPPYSSVIHVSIQVMLGMCRVMLLFTQSADPRQEGQLSDKEDCMVSRGLCGMRKTVWYVEI